MNPLVEFFERVAALRREGQSFAVATVVARRAPVSAHLGDRAIVFADGRMDGFVGGACAREIVRRQAIEALTARQPRLVSIRPDAREGVPSAEHVFVPMSCVSEGAVDVYLEPFVRTRAIVVVGATPVATAVMRLARSMQYDVVRVVDARERRDIEPEAVSVGATCATLEELEDVLQQVGADPADRFAVVASQGHYDEPALETILKCGASYVGLVASPKRGATVKALLHENGTPDVASIRNPAGLDLGARTPPEVALSILSEIVQRRPSQSTAASIASAPASARESPAQPVTAVDPVCHMVVEVATARHTAESDGVAYYFCCSNCRARFVKQPQEFLSKAPALSEPNGP